MPVTQEHIRGVNRAALDCVRLAFKLYRLFDPFPLASQNPELAKKRDDILGKVRDLGLMMLVAIGDGLREYFGVANARAGRAERIEIDGEVLATYHDYAVYLLMAVGINGRKLPLDKQRNIEQDVRDEAKRALAFLDFAPKLAPDLSPDDQVAKVAAIRDKAERNCLTVIDELVYEIEGLINEYKAVRGGHEPMRRVSYEERKALLIKDNRYLTGGGIAITPRAAPPLPDGENKTTPSVDTPTLPRAESKGTPETRISRSGAAEEYKNKYCDLSDEPLSKSAAGKRLDRMQLDAQGQGKKKTFCLIRFMRMLNNLGKEDDNEPRDASLDDLKKISGRKASATKDRF